MGKYIERILRYKFFVFGWMISVFNLILNRGFNIRWNFLNLIAMFAYLAQLILLGYDAVKSGKIRIRDIVYPILIVSVLYGLFILINYLAYIFHF